MMIDAHRSRTTLRAIALCLGALTFVGIGAVSGCSEDDVEIPDELRGDPYCAVIVNSYGYFEDGTRLLIANYPRNAVAVSCVCSDLDEILSGARDQELNDLALEECQYWASTKDFVSNDCLEDYAAGEWLQLIVHAEGEDAGYKPADFDCYGP